MALSVRTKRELTSVCPHVKLKRSLGQGGNGCVYLAAHKDYGEVAIKFFLNNDMRRWQRFTDEVKVVATHLRNSPRVVPILEAWLPEPGIDSVPWYIMPKAETIRDVVKNLNWREMLPTFVELADGLVEIHRVGVAHRDIKPDNLFRLDGGYRFGDFGIASFPDRAGITKEDEPMGPASFMAPEMETNSRLADCYLADVYSLAKTIWALLTKEKVAFPGQYRPKGREGLAARAKKNELVLEPLELLLEQATDSLPRLRPKASEFSTRLREVAAIQYDVEKANQLQWEFASLEAMTGQGIARAEWRDPAAICNVIRLLSRYHGMNHCFLPEGGGQHIKGVNLCEGGRMLSLQISGGGTDYIVSPIRLVVERFPNQPAFGYAVLEVGEVDRLTEGDAFLDGMVEKLRRLNDFDYVPDDGDSYEPQFSEFGESCYRRFKRGLLVLAPTYGIYNRIDDYTGTAERLGLEELRRQYAELVEMVDTAKPEPRTLVPVVRLLLREVARVPFDLQYLSMPQFWSLFDLDEQMLKARCDSGSVIVGSGELLEVLRNMSTDPTRQRAKALLTELTTQQKGEYLALVEVAKGYIDPHEMAAQADGNARSSYEISYLLEKLGNGYLRRALRKFGVEPLGATVAVEAKAEDGSYQ